MSNLQIQFVHHLCFLHRSYPFHPYCYSSLEVRHTIVHREGGMIEMACFQTVKAEEDTIEMEGIDLN